MKTHITILCLFALIIGVLMYTLFTFSTCQDDKNPHYILEMYDTEIKVTDPTTGKVIYTEKYDSNSKIINSLLEDNE